MTSGLSSIGPTQRVRWYELHFRHALIPATFITLFAVIVELWLRGRYVRPSHICSGCGYDLRATPDRCPECGHVPEQLAPKTPSL